jgi:AraC-like DNA-binding protein
MLADALFCNYFVIATLGAGLPGSPGVARRDRRNAGREAHLGPGDFTFCDASRPYQMSFRKLSNVLIIRVLRQQILRYIGRPEAVVAVIMPGDAGLSGLVSRHLRELWRASPEFLTHGASSRMMDMTLQLLASAYSAAPEARADRMHRAVTLRRQALELIEQQLRDSELSPSRLAGLRNPLFAGRSITAIAFASGFNSMAHFSRVFREHYDVSPSEHRHA